MAEAKGPLASRAPPVARGTVARGYTSLQKRLKVGSSSDRFEREADRIASHVVGSSAMTAAAPPPAISPLAAQRMPLDDLPASAPEEPAQRRAAPASPETSEDAPVVQRMGLDDMPETAQMMRKTGPEAPEEDPRPPKTADTAQMAQRTMRGTGPEAPKDESADLMNALTAQREAGGPGADGGTAPAGVERSISRMRGGSAPGIEPGIRHQMEDKIGVNLGGVRVHTGEAAAQAADGLNAKAFTVGQDMFFGRGQYDPGSTEGRRLIAHETAHTVQQLGGTAAAQRVQRATTTPPAPKSEIATKSGEIDLKTSPGTVVLETLELPLVGGLGKGFAQGKKFQPAAKNGIVPNSTTSYTLSPPGPRPSTKASDIWTDYAKNNAATGAKTELQNLIDKNKNVDTILGKGDTAVYAVKLPVKNKDAASSIMMGTVEELSKNDAILRPQFTHTGVPTPMDADHILEWQLGGDFGAKNLQMLEAKFNQRVGRELNNQINKRITTVLDQVDQYKTKNPSQKFTKTLPKNAKQVRASWTLKFNKLKEANGRGSTGRYWSRHDLEQGKQVKKLKALTTQDMIKQGFKPPAGSTRLKYINVFPSIEGGRVAQFEVSKDGTTLYIPDFFYYGIEIVDVTNFKNPLENFDEPRIAELKVRHKLGKKKRKQAKQQGQSGLTSVEFNIGLNTAERLGTGSYISRQELQAGYKNALTAQGLSPIVLSNTHVDPGGRVRADGNILATKALFPGLKIPLTLAGEEVYIDFPIPASQISLGPVKITDPTVKVGYGKNGIFLSGGVGLEVDKVGKGALSVNATRKDMLFKGNFVFDFDFVEKAELKAEYSVANDALKVNGTLVMKKGTLPGVDSGKIDVAVTRETFGLTGQFQLGGLLAGSVLTVGYTPKDGLVVEGKDLPLPVDKLPGVSDAKVTVRVRRSPEGLWLVSGGGSAALKAPGASGKLGIKMKGEAFKFDGRIELAKGPAKGYIQVTATNMALDDKGDPIEGGPVGELQIWGKGSATIAFGKVLTGTAGIEYTKDGRIIISGEIALPPKVDLFKRKSYNKRILTLEPPNFWIWGIEVGPFGVGVFAFVDARLDFDAYVGPGQLRDTKVKAVMDLDKPEEAKVEGNATFNMPAYAGFKLDLGGGLKAKVTVAYVKGRVGLDGSLGLAQETNLNVGVKWNAKDGFEASALAEIKASPKLELGVNASVTAGADLLVKDIKKTWGPWRKKLGEFGPNVELKATFPVKYTDKAGLDLDLSKIKVTKPKLDAKALMKDAFKTLV